MPLKVDQPAQQKEKIINELKEVLKRHPEYTFKYKKE
jgi:hypothetical protein